MGIDDLLQNLFQLLLTNQEIHFQLQEVFRLGTIYVAKVLRQDLVKEKSSQGGFHIAGDLLAISIFLGHADGDMRM